MSFDVVEHTADVRVVVEAATLEELFADALRGVMSVMGGGLPEVPLDIHQEAFFVSRFSFFDAHPGETSPTTRRGGGEKRETRNEKRSFAHFELTTDSPDLTALLVDFLNDALVLVHTRRCTFEPVSIVLDGTTVRAELRTAGPLLHDVKAVTYHEADVRQADGIWRTNLVLDI